MSAEAKKGADALLHGRTLSATVIDRRYSDALRATVIDRRYSDALRATVIDRRYSDAL